MDYSALKTKFDSSSMITEIDRFLEVFNKAFEQGMSTPLPEEFKTAEHVMGVGMGGSGMGYKLLLSLAKKYGTLPISLVSDYDLLPYSRPKTAVFATSFSGSTEETLRAVEQGVAKKMPIVCVTTGGKLAQYAQDNALTLVQFQYPVAPRVGLPYSFGIVLGLFVQAGYLNVSADEIKKAAVDVLPLQQAWKMSVPEETNQAMQIAAKIKDRMLYVVGGGLSEAVAIRWKGQFNENSKAIAFAEAMPEMCHNMVLGYKNPGAIRMNSAMIYLASPFDNSRNLFRIDILEQMFSAEGVAVIKPKVDEKLSYIGTMLAQIILGDYVSYYLALLNGEDPVEMNRITELKQKLDTQKT